MGGAARKLIATFLLDQQIYWFIDTWLWRVKPVINLWVYMFKDGNTAITKVNQLHSTAKLRHIVCQNNNMKVITLNLYMH